jgi:hypothetical protein
LKVTINGETLRTVRVGDWTFRQSDMVRALTSTLAGPGLMPGDIMGLILQDDPRAHLAFAIVGYMLAGRDPTGLPDMTIESITTDFTEDGATSDPPPDGGTAAAKPKKRAAKPRVKKSVRKS